MPTGYKRYKYPQNVTLLHVLSVFLLGGTAFGWISLLAPAHERFLGTREAFYTLM